MNTPYDDLGAPVDLAAVAAWNRENARARATYMWEQHGDTPAPVLKPVKRKPRTGPTCERTTCERAPWRHALCRPHYDVILRNKGARA